MIAIVDYKPGRINLDELRKVLNRIIGGSANDLSKFHTEMKSFLGADWFIHEGGHHVSMEKQSTNTIIKVVDLYDSGLSLGSLSKDLLEEKALRKK